MGKYYNFAFLSEMSQAEITLYRPILYSIAYRMVGCAAVAEDMVQDTFLNWLKIDQNKITNVKAYLTKSVTNACLNHLESFRQKKEELFDSISPNLPRFNINPDFAHLDFKQEMTQAFGQLFKKLPPTERAVFVLKGVFNMDYSELTEILDKKSEHCRQLFCRAQHKLSEEKERFQMDTEKVLSTIENFKKATLGEFSELVEGLKMDISAEKE